jgi:hypothetical protein
VIRFFLASAKSKKEVLPRRVAARQGLDRNDAVAHHEAQEGHGIDVVFIYDVDLYKA